MSQLATALCRPLTRPLTSAVTEGVGGGGAWAAALPALRTFVTANYNQPNPHNQAVMASPPAIVRSFSKDAAYTVGGSITPATVDSAILRINGGTLASMASLQRVYSAIVGQFGGNGGDNDGKNCSAWRAEVSINAASVIFRIGPSTTRYRFIVDGQYVDLTGTITQNTTGTSSEFIELVFAAKAAHTIQIEGQQTCSITQAWVKTGDTITRPSDTPKRICFAGDSIANGSYATAYGDGFGWYCADMLGFKHALASGASGTGYAATNSGANYQFATRVVTDVNGKGPWDVIVVAMGVNDILQTMTAADITAQTTASLLAIRNGNPTAQIIVVGPWNVAAPSVPAAYTTCKNAILAGIPGIGAYFVDPQAVTYTQTDGIHPDTAGHATLGAWLALQIKTALGA